MTGDFNWWLLVVGAVAGVAITWLLLADSKRRDDELADHLFVCPQCGHHFPVRAHARIAQIVDAGSFVEADGDLLLERWALRRKSDLFTSIFGLEVDLAGEREAN